MAMTPTGCDTSDVAVGAAADGDGPAADGEGPAADGEGPADDGPPDDAPDPHAVSSDTQATALRIARRGWVIIRGSLQTLVDRRSIDLGQGALCHRDRPLNSA